MKFSRKIFLTTALGVLTLLLSQGAALAQTEVPVNYSWTAPVTGSPVDHYVVEHSLNGGAWTQVGTASSNTFTLTASVGDAHQIRVAGVDAQDRQGPYSSPSDPYSPDVGPPGQPGKPILF